MHGLKEDLENIDLLAKVVVVRKAISLDISRRQRSTIIQATSSQMPLSIDKKAQV